MTPPETPSPAMDASGARAASIPPADFSDRLSPMLVKELRQGLRTRMFTTVFILLQVLLLFLTFVSSSASRANEILGGFFWFCLMVTLLVICPLRGVNALSQEARLNTLELILLTRLDAFRIVLGKWASIVSQSALLAVAVLPYVVLRYFFGGVDLLQDLVGLVALFYLSAVVTALAVGLSAFSALLLRTAFFVGAGIACMYLVGFAMSRAFGGSLLLPVAGVGVRSWAIGAAGVVFTGAFFIYYFLDMGAARVAPPSANHATRKRLVALGAVLFIFAFPALGADPAFAASAAALVAIVACVDALTETPTVTAGVFQGFLSRRLVPPFAKWFLAPGWHTGILFTLVVMGAFAAFAAAHYYSPTDPGYYGAPVVVASVIFFPVLVTQLFFRNSSQLMTPYVGIQLFCLVVTLVLTMASEGADVKWVLWDPLESTCRHASLSIL